MDREAPENEPRSPRARIPFPGASPPRSSPASSRASSFRVFATSPRTSARPVSAAIAWTAPH
eukprot:15369861-Alexandrium_andersonii.AAC.1